MTDFEFDTCFEVDEDVIERALAEGTPPPREKVFDLIRRMADVSSPRQGASRVLFVFGRLAVCEWLGGRLDVRVRAGGGVTEVDVLVDDGSGTEPIHPTFFFNAPFAEFLQAAQHRASDLEPLIVQPGKDGELRLRVPSRKGMRPETLESQRAPDSSSLMQHRPTIKMLAVKIPPEAYREDDPRARMDTPPREIPTYRPSEPPPSTTRAEVEIPTEAKRAADLGTLELDDLDELPASTAKPIKRPRRLPLPAKSQEPISNATPGTSAETDDLDEGWD